MNGRNEQAGDCLRCTPDDGPGWDRRDNPFQATETGQSLERSFSIGPRRPRRSGLIEFIQQLSDREDGQSLPEYVLLVATVVAMVVVAAILYADQVKALFSDVGTYIGANDGL